MRASAYQPRGGRSDPWAASACQGNVRVFVWGGGLGTLRRTSPNMTLISSRWSDVGRLSGGAKAGDLGLRRGRGGWWRRKVEEGGVRGGRRSAVEGSGLGLERGPLQK